MMIWAVLALHYHPILLRLILITQGVFTIKKPMNPTTFPWEEEINRKANPYQMILRSECKSLRPRKEAKLLFAKQTFLFPFLRWRPPPTKNNEFICQQIQSFNGVQSPLRREEAVSLSHLLEDSTEKLKGATNGGHIWRGEIFVHRIRSQWRLAVG